MKFYEDETMNYTTEELAQMDTIKVDDMQIATKLMLLGFEGVYSREAYYFLATPKMKQCLMMLQRS